MLVELILHKKAAAIKIKAPAEQSAATSNPARVPVAAAAPALLSVSEKAPRLFGYGLPFALRPSSGNLALQVAGMACEGKPGNC